ncbi:MAG: DUF4261 domain-containing protein [Granulosicoccaceae bacterium]
MSILTRFFGGKESVSEKGLLANEQLETSLSLQVVFSGGLDLSAAELEKQFRSHHQSLKKARIEIDDEANRQGTPIGLIGWGEHVVKIVGFDQPMPADVLESSVLPSHYDEALKSEARAHKSHLLLYYQGYDNNPVNQYASMALIGGFLSCVGAIIVVNESACTSLPAGALNGDTTKGDIVSILENFPLTALYCGLVKYEVEDIDGVWLRTYGCPLLGLPDLASLADDHSGSEEVFDIFNNVLSYLLDSGVQFVAGNTMQVGEDLFMKLRLASADEYYLESEGELFVAEFISASEIN